MTLTSLHLIIKGKVQGVYFRASARDLAVKLGLSGWIKNTPEGHVVTCVTGSQKQVTEFLDWCKKGPPGARVDSVTEAVAGNNIESSDFIIIR